MSLRTWLLAVMLSVYFPVILGGPAVDSTPNPTRARLDPVDGAYAGITEMTNAGDSRLFIVEQAGVIQVVEGGKKLAAPFLDIKTRVTSGGEQGLLGLAFHPDYATNGYFYVYYTYTHGNQLRSRISRFTVGSDRNVADPDSEQVVLEFNQLAENHNGGAIHFGPDGYLYIASGDGGGAFDPSNNGQRTMTLLGKILRLDVNSTSGGDCNVAANGHYGIPATNPFADGRGGAACDEIWAYGLRNPWRISFDRATGDLWIADVGQGAREEIDFQPRDVRGQNYGWDCWEGTLWNPTDPSPTCAAHPPTVAPLYEYDHSGGRCSITGGYVYRGLSFAGFRGAYFFADFCSGEMWTLKRTYAAPAVVELALSGAPLKNPRTFGQDAAGELYVASGNAVYRIIDPAVAP